MLHGGAPSHSSDMLGQLLRSKYLINNEDVARLIQEPDKPQLDFSSCLVAAGMVTGALHNALHRHNPSMQWPFQQYSGSIHWLRRLEAGNATAADKAHLRDFAYSRLYPAGLHSESRLRHPSHPRATCPLQGYQPVHIMDILRATPVPHLDFHMVTGWLERPEYDHTGGRLLDLKLDIQVVDIDHPAGPACNGCQPYTLGQPTQGETGVMDAALSRQQHGKDIHKGGGATDPAGQARHIPGYPSSSRRGYYYTTKPTPNPVLWQPQDWSEIDRMRVVFELFFAGVLVAWVCVLLWTSRRRMHNIIRRKVRQLQQRQQQQQGSMRSSLGVPRLILGWVGKLPWSRVLLALLMLLLIVIVMGMEEALPAAAATVAQGWAQVRQALHLLVADCLAYAVFTLAYWRCLPNRGPVLSLLPVLGNIALVQFVWYQYVMMEDCPGLDWDCITMESAVSTLLSRWAMMSAGIYLFLIVVKCVEWTIATVVGLRAWVLLQCEEGQTTTQAQAHQQQQQHDSVCRWSRLPQEVQWLLKTAVKVVLSRTTLLALVVADGVSPLERGWPAGAVAAAQWWFRVQLALHPLVAGCLGNMVVSVACWLSLPGDVGSVSLLLQLLAGTVLSQAGVYWCVAGRTPPQLMLLSVHLRNWLLVTLVVAVVLCPHTIVAQALSHAPHAIRRLWHHRGDQASSPAKQQLGCGSKTSSTNSSSSSGKGRRRVVAPRHGASAAAAAVAAGAAAASQQAAGVVGSPGARGRGWAWLEWWAHLGAVCSHGWEQGGAQDTSETHATPSPPAPAAAEAPAPAAANTTATATTGTAPAPPAAGVPACGANPSPISSQAASPAPDSVPVSTAAWLSDSIGNSADSAACPDQQQQQPAVPSAQPTSTATHHTSSSSTAISGTCRVCGVPRGPGVKLLKCVRCGSGADRYCSAACFREDWPRHRLTCQ
jgi:hypothetical protein